MLIRTAFTIGLLAMALPCQSAIEFELLIKDHLFYPAELRVPAGEKIKLRVINQDDSTEEFESFELNREKLISGNSQTVIFIGPLPAGEYPFFGEFHPATAQGKIIAEEQ